MDWSSLIVGIVVGALSIAGVVYTQRTSFKAQQIAMAERLSNEAEIRESNQIREDKIRTENSRREDVIRRENADRDDKIRAELSQSRISERWWERKADTYTFLIEAVWKSKESASDEMDHLVGASQRLVLSNEELAERSKAYEHRSDEISKHAEIGGFLISDAASEALAQYVKIKNQDVEQNDWMSLLNREYEAAEECLEILRSEAATDLRIGVSASTAGV